MRMRDAKPGSRVKIKESTRDHDLPEWEIGGAAGRIVSVGDDLIRVRFDRGTFSQEYLRAFRKENGCSAYTDINLSAGDVIHHDGVTVVWPKAGKKIKEKRRRNVRAVY